MAKCPYCNTELTGIFRCLVYYSNNDNPKNNYGQVKNRTKQYGDLIGQCKKCLCGFALHPKINR